MVIKTDDLVLSFIIMSIILMIKPAGSGPRKLCFLLICWLHFCSNSLTYNVKFIYGLFNDCFFVVVVQFYM